MEIDVKLGGELLKHTPLIVLLNGIPEHEYSRIREERLLADIFLNPAPLVDLVEVSKTLLQQLLGVTLSPPLVSHCEDVGFVELLADQSVQVRVVLLLLYA